MDPRVNQIWQNFHDRLREYALARLKNEEDVNDLMQNIFIKIVQNIDKIDQAENTKHYLLAVVRNAINDIFRTRQHHETDAILVDSPEEFNHQLNEIVANCCVRPFIEKLPEKYKEALVLSEIAGIPQNEIAHQLNISYSGLKSRVQRGRQKLKQLILDCCRLESDRYGNLIGSGSDSCSGCGPELP